MHLLQRIRNVLSTPTNQQRNWPAGFVALALAACVWTLSLNLFGSLTPAARAADEHRGPAATDERLGERLVAPDLVLAAGDEDAAFLAQTFERGDGSAYIRSDYGLLDGQRV